MAIKIDCPRCKTPLQVPDAQAGEYVNCVHCKGRLWIPKDGRADETPAQTTVAPEIPSNLSAPPEPRLSSPTGAPKRGALETALASLRAPMRSETPSSRAPAPLVPVPPSAPSPRKRVARFITAEATDSTLRPAADGKLPELHLEEDTAKERPDIGQRSVNPLVLVGVLSISVVLSILLVLMEGETPPASNVGKKSQMRQKLADHYFGLGTIDTRPLEPYQLLLREARQAFSRGDYKTEREHYRKVLDMLRADHGSEDRGLTGSALKDKDLEEALSVLLSGG